MKFAAIGPIAVHLPGRVETNEDLQREHPNWDMDVIFQKTGIYKRHIAEPDQCASDLGVLAAEKLFAEHDVDPASIDYLLFCTQTPDYAIPTTACLMQQRLGLRTNIGALDFNLGCSGYVYGMSLADGLVRSGQVKRCLLITAETYTKLIHPSDRSLRTIFGDAAAATLIDAVDEPTMWAFKFGTDGSGANTLLASGGGFRSEQNALQPRHRRRWPSALYMDGPSLMSFAVAAIPDVIQDVATEGGVAVEEIDLFLLHQATLKMLDLLRERMGVPQDRWPVCLKDVGNTVSSTLPILIDQLRKDRTLTPDMTTAMIGFGVGWSWAGCLWRDVLGKNSS